MLRGKAITMQTSSTCESSENGQEKARGTASAKCSLMIEREEVSGEERKGELPCRGKEVSESMDGAGRKRIVPTG